MSHPKPHVREGAEGSWDARRARPIPTDWQWLAALTRAELDADFIEAVEERADVQERPRLKNLFD